MEALTVKLLPAGSGGHASIFLSHCLEREGASLVLFMFNNPVPIFLIIPYTLPPPARP